ncbi:hypothetical protein H072_6685 [Dactylellina haptotyla CBS 200.50]|uniref:Uncharacterized protein n=1 Tax=Dactylellina haptotyla (strain CBS 200.50) TaxID=1284197 RepID=S8A904_DACHA|nr:hypothetical protein H072_6685 [Dactylellina haptotyla CBS 200.50]
MRKTQERVTGSPEPLIDRLEAILAVNESSRDPTPVRTPNGKHVLCPRCGTSLVYTAGFRWTCSPESSPETKESSLEQKLDYGDTTEPKQVSSNEGKLECDKKPESVSNKHQDTQSNSTSTSTSAKSSQKVNIKAEIDGGENPEKETTKEPKGEPGVSGGEIERELEHEQEPEPESESESESEWELINNPRLCERTRKWVEKTIRRNLRSRPYTDFGENEIIFDGPESTGDIFEKFPLSEATFVTDHKRVLIDDETRIVHLRASANDRKINNHQTPKRTCGKSIETALEKLTPMGSKPRYDPNRQEWHLQKTKEYGNITTTDFVGFASYLYAVIGWNVCEKSDGTEISTEPARQKFGKRRCQRGAR